MIMPMVVIVVMIKGMVTLIVGVVSMSLVVVLE